EVERLRAKSACTCSWVDPEYWTTHYEAIEPGSMQEYEPTCPIHGELRERAEMAEDEVERLTDMRERLREKHIAADEVIRAILRELGRGPDAEPVSETRQVVAEVERLRSVNDFLLGELQVDDDLRHGNYRDFDDIDELIAHLKDDSNE